MAEEIFTREELEAIRDRAAEYALQTDDASFRTALQVLGEAAANLLDKLPGTGVPDESAVSGT